MAGWVGIGGILQEIRRLREHVCSKRKVLAVLLVVIGLSLPFCFGPAQAKVFDEAQVKAVFLYNLTKFIVWPKTDRQGGETFTFALLGDVPLSDHLDEVVFNETVGGRKILIERYSRTGEIAWQDIDMLLIADEFLEEVKVLSKKAVQHQVLIVGQVDGFCQYGGAINLLTEDRRVRIEVNLEEVKRAGFAVSAQVLKLSRIVASEGEPSW